MNLQNWLSNHWIVQHQSSADEARQMLERIRRDIKSAQIPELEADWRMNIAYNASRTCADVALRVSGYRMRSESGAHEKVIRSLEFTLMTDSETITALQALRTKRGMVTYDGSIEITDTEAAEALEIAEELHASLMRWLNRHHPEYLPD